MRKVLLLLYNWGNGGYESYVQSLVQKLHNKDCTFLIAYSEKLPMPEVVSDLSIHAVHIPMESPFDLKAAKEVAALCKELSVDVVHTHFIRERYIAVLSRLFKNRAKLIYTSHVLAKKTSILKMSNRIINTFEDKVIAVCEAGKEQMLQEKLKKEKIEVVYNGTEISYWEENVSSTLRLGLGLTEEDFVVTCIGRFYEVKGHRFLIESIKLCMKQMDEEEKERFKVVLVGEGELLELCKQLAMNLGLSQTILFTGYRTDVKNILKGSNLYVSPSKSEALSMSIIEALSSGIPVLATNVGGTKEIIQGEREGGMLAQYGDCENFSKGILKFMRDKDYYRECSENAKANVRKKFSLDNMVKETYNLYHRI